MKPGEAEDLPESDAVAGAPHPRFAQGFVGHKAAEAELLSAYRDGRLAHAWLIGGPEGVGKATLAWRFARFLLANPDPSTRFASEARDLDVEPNHPAARRLAALAHPDFALIRREWKANPKRLGAEIGVDDVRRALQVFQMSAAFGGWRICIVDCAEDLNRNSANALLKMIEEPPQRSLILIVSHRPGQVPPTIRSRCRRLKLDPLSAAEIADVVAMLGAPWSEADPEAIAEAAGRANGSVREALTRLAADAEGIGRLIDSTIADLPRPDPRAVARLSEALASRAAAEAYRAFHRELYDWLVAYASRTASSIARAEELGALWDRIRAAARETEALNLDRRLHLLAIFAEIAATARRTR
ncbi:MAG: DNA polymerase III subunit delta' [Hyphomicrobiales bacterium]|nr:DNA polymerase III subunit delta' [Hyphomicrobiales bacterium]